LNDRNFRLYSNQPKANDIKIVALSFAAKAIQINYENMLFSLLKNAYTQYRKNYQRGLISMKEVLASLGKPPIKFNRRILGKIDNSNVWKSNWANAYIQYRPLKVDQAHFGFIRELRNASN
jgi:hypothetical protein